MRACLILAAVLAGGRVSCPAPSQRPALTSESTAKCGAAVTSIPCHREIRNSTAPHFAVLPTDALHDMEWIVGLMDARAPAPNRPETYRKRKIPN